MGKYHLEIRDSLPLEYHDKVELWLETVLDFLMSVPRPQSKSLPEIPQLIPDFTDIKFATCDHFNAPHGLFHRKDWHGYAVIPAKTNGDLLIETTPHLTLFMDQDVALASMVCWVHLLDQMFLAWKHPETHLYRQIQFLEKFNPELHKKFIKERNAARSKAQRIKNRQNFKQRNAASQDRKRKPLSQSAQSPKPTDTQSLIRPPINSIHAPVQKPITTPTPELSKHQREIVAQHQALWDCVRERTETSCEDFDK
jgi:hypothetical protein